MSLQELQTLLYIVLILSIVDLLFFVLVSISIISISNHFKTFVGLYRKKYIEDKLDVSSTLPSA